VQRRVRGRPFPRNQEEVGDMPTEQPNILEKVKKLLALSERNSCVEEATSAAAKVQDLLLKYNLTMQEVREASGEKQEECWRFDAELGSYTGKDRWRHRLLFHIARNNLCDCVTFEGRTKQAVFGSPKNVAVSLFMYDYLEGQIIAHAFDGKPPRVRRDGWLNDFGTGAAEKIGERLEEQRRATLDSVGGRALVVTTAALVKQKVREDFPRLSSSYSSYRPGAGHASGQAFGSQVNLGVRGVGSGSSPKQIGGR